jgi:hypothetical protein
MVFDTEGEMVNTIKNSKYICQIRSPGPSLLEEEVNGFFGIPDIIIVKKTNKKHISYAYEAKLSNWNRALYQAFRYKAFVNKSIVILDHDRVKSALANLNKFSSAKVGLISIENSGRVHIHYNPPNEYPYSPQLGEKFNEQIAKSVYNL